MIEVAKITREPPFLYRAVEFKFDEHVNLFIGPNASGKSTILRKLASQTQDNHFKFGFEGNRYPEYQAGMSRSQTEHLPNRQDAYREESRLYAQQMPWVFIPPARLSIPFSDSDGLRELLGEKNSVQQDLSHILAPQGVPDVFDGKIVYLAIEVIKQKLLTKQGETPESRNMLKAIDLPYRCAQGICRDILSETKHHDYIQSIPLSVEGNVTTSVVHHDMGVETTDRYQQEGGVFVGDLSSGTQGTLLWIWYLALSMAVFYDFEDGWEEQPAVLLIDEVENHLHPTWQRRVIPALRKYFPGVQIFATTHSPFVVAGLKAGQIHSLERDENGVMSGPPQKGDVIGWTVSEILRGLMDVDYPTDEPTAINAARLGELRSKRTSEEGLSDDEEAEMRDLRKSVSGDMLAGGALNAQRDRLADTLKDFMQSQLAKTPEEKTIADYDRAIAISLNDAVAYRHRGLLYAEMGEYTKAIADYDRAVAIDPNDVVAYRSRGDAYIKIGENDKAASDYNRAVAKE